MNGPINKGVSSALPTVFSRRSTILKIVEEKALGTRLMKVPELQNFLKARDIQIVLGGKKRKKAELLELCKNAAEMQMPKVDEEIESGIKIIFSNVSHSFEFPTKFHL